MAKKAKTKTSTKKKTPVTMKAKTAPASKEESKYDQPGAPWWKKFRPSETRAL